MVRLLDRSSTACAGVAFVAGLGPWQAADLCPVLRACSYAIASISAFLSSFCYAEFAVSMPLAGAAYNYIKATLGEFVAWCVVRLCQQYLAVKFHVCFMTGAAAVHGSTCPCTVHVSSTPSTAGHELCTA